MDKTLKATFLLCLRWIHFSSVGAMTPAILTDATEQIPLGLHLEILEEVTGNWTLEDVLTSPISQHFYRNTQKVPNFGFGAPVIWVRFQRNFPTR